MLMVMPRSFSSGALSIESYARYCACFFSASTFVIAAVSVVLPWSMCPIFPTLQCGLLRSNFSFAMMSSPVTQGRPLGQPPKLSRAARVDHRLGQIGRQALIVMKLHCIYASALTHRPQVGGVAKHFGQGHPGPNGLRIGAALRALNRRAARAQIAQHVAHKFFRYRYFHLHHWLLQRGVALEHPLFEGHRAGDLEGHV